MEDSEDKLGKVISDLLSGDIGYSFSSGRAAFATVLDLVETGAHIIASENLSNDVYKIFESVRRRTSGLTFSYVKDFSQQTLKLVTPEPKSDRRQETHTLVTFSLTGQNQRED